MTDYRQHPNSNPRGGHAPVRASQQQPYQQRPSVSRPAPSAQPVPQAYRPIAGAYGSGVRPGSRGPGRRSPQQDKKRGGVWRAVFWIALAVFIAALVALGAIAFSYWQGQQTYKEIAQEGFMPPNDVKGTPLGDLTVDWDALKAINPDTVAWMYVPGTVINYPIVHTSDNETYLSRDFRGGSGGIATFGAIFLAAENAADFSDKNNIIYGHHLNDGSMFAPVAAMQNADEFNASRTIYILTPQGNYRLTTFSLVHTTADDPLAQTTFATEEERITYVQDKIDRSVVAVSDVPAAADIKRTFAFATCDNLPTNGRLVLFAYVAESTVKTGSGGAVQAPGTPSDGLAEPGSAEVIDGAAKEIAS